VPQNGGSMWFIAKIKSKLFGLYIFFKHLCAEEEIFNSKISKTVMKNLVPKINAEIESLQKNVQLQLEKGNKAAGTRARKSALELSKLLKEFRKVSVEAAKK
jgi:hypothetical protein